MTDPKAAPKPKSAGVWILNLLENPYFVAAQTVTIAILLVFVLVLWSELRSNLDAQVPNRVHNVELWCNGINETREYDRHFVESVFANTPGQDKLLYRLGELPCYAIEHNTAKSAKQ